MQNYPILKIIISHARVIFQQNKQKHSNNLACLATIIKAKTVSKKTPLFYTRKLNAAFTELYRKLYSSGRSESDK